MKLDGKTLHHVLERYHLYDLSVNAFLNNIKVCLFSQNSTKTIQMATMIHYSTNPLSIFTDFDANRSDHLFILKSLRDRELDVLRATKSFREYALCRISHFE